MSRKGEFVTETLECGCRVSGTIGETDSYSRRPCSGHTEGGACAICRDGESHVVCAECGLGDGRHSSDCPLGVRA